MAEGPIDYSSMIAPPNLGASFAQGLQIGDALHRRFKRRSGDEAFEDRQREVWSEKQQIGMDADRAAQVRQQQYLADVNAVLTHPTPEGYRQLGLRYPEQHEALKNAWGQYTEGQQTRNLQHASGVFGALTNDRPDIALSLLQRRREALRSGGEDTTETDALIQMVESGDPEQMEHARGFAGMVLAAATGPEKVADTLSNLGDEYREADLHPAVKRKAEADADTAETTAQYLPQEKQGALREQEAAIEQRWANVDNIRSEIENRADRLELDRDTLQTNVDLRLREMDEKAADLSPGAETQVTNFVVSAESARALAGRAAALANEFQTKGGTAGPFASLADWTGANGKEAARLRREYAGLVNSQAIKNLPPGAASDNDIKMALRGFPPTNAKPSTVSQFLKGFAKMQEMAANSDQAKADWIAGNGSLGSARKDLWVNGTRVPQGSTYGEFSKTMARVQRREKPQDRSYMRHGR